MTLSRYVVVDNLFSLPSIAADEPKMVLKAFLFLLSAVVESCRLFLWHVSLLTMFFLTKSVVGVVFFDAIVAVVLVVYDYTVSEVIVISVAGLVG